MTQRRLDEGKRPRISVSLDPEDYDWIQSLKGPSESYTVSRVVKAARLAGLTLDEAKSSGVLEGFRDWLKSRRRKNTTATELAEILTDYLGK
jgi:hypothetical protein